MNKQFSGYETIASGYSNNMYLPRAPLDEWTLDELRRALCAKANGDVLACEECENRCRYGRRIVELLKPVEMEKVEKPAINLAKSKGGKKTGAARHEKSENAYLQAIASGNPKQWFIDHGRDVRNGMVRMKQRFPGMTAEEAKARLAVKGIAVECEKVEPVKVTVKNPAPVVKPEPVKTAPAGVGLRVSAVQGKVLNYRIGEHVMWISMPDGCKELGIKNVDKLDELCNEIRAAFEMLGGGKNAAD